MINFIIGLVVGGTIGMLATAVVTGSKNPAKVFAEDADPTKQSSTRYDAHVDTSSGTGFWQALLPDLRKVCGPAAYGYLANEAICAGKLDGDTLTVYAKDEFCFDVISEIRVFKGMEEAATARAGRPIKVMILHTAGDGGR